MNEEQQRDPGSYRNPNGKLIPAVDTVGELALVLTTGTAICLNTIALLPAALQEKSIDAVISTVEDHINAFLAKKGWKA